MSDRKTASAEPTGTSAPSSEKTVAPAPSRTATAPEESPSAAAIAVARAMRRFDPELTGDQIDTIAASIAARHAACARLTIEEPRLRNSDEPVTTFVLRPARG